MATIEEEVVESKYNGNAFLRLLGYVKPYIKKMLFCFCLVLIITVLDLVRPMLIANAIDTYIEGYNRPYAVVDKSNSELVYNGLYLTKDYENLDVNSYAYMAYFSDNYYLFTDLTEKDLNELQSLTSQAIVNETDSVNQLVISGYTGELLLKEDLKTLRSGDLKGLELIALLYALVLFGNVTCNLMQTWTLQKTGQDIIFTIRQEVFTHVHSLPLRYFDTHPNGRTVTRVTNDVESVNQMYTNILVQLFRNVVMIIGYSVVMLNINTKLAFMCFAFLPVILVLTYYFRTWARRIYRIVRTKISSLNTFLAENISGMKLIQVFAREEEKLDEFKGKTKDLYKSQIQELMVMSTFRPVTFFIANFALTLVIYFGGKNVIDGYLTLGTLYIFVNYISSFFEPIQSLAEQFSTLQNAIASAEKIFTVLDEENPIKEPENPIVPEKIKGKIEFRNVWFAYEKEDYVLKDVSFTIMPGEKVAFVGATGAGKSSILNLIGRYYDIQKGEILIDDINIKDLSTQQIRHAIGQVQQDVFIFTGDINSNIRLLNQNITDQDIIKASQAVNADHFINSLPKKYEEEVTERGATLSAGQRQLLSFARTLAVDPTILVMDEATANIDTETEQLIQDALETMMSGRTTIMVAHRLSTIQHADNIIVMHHGRVRESGNHQQLLAQNGIYKKLYEIQLYSK